MDVSRRRLFGLVAAAAAVPVAAKLPVVAAAWPTVTAYFPQKIFYNGDQLFGDMLLREVDDVQSYLNQRRSAELVRRCQSEVDVFVNRAVTLYKERDDGEG